MRFWGRNIVYIAVGNEVEYDSYEEVGHLYLPDHTRDGLDYIDPRRYDYHGQRISPYVLPPMESMEAAPPVDFTFQKYEPEPWVVAECERDPYLLENHNAPFISRAHPTQMSGLRELNNTGWLPLLFL